MLDAMIPNAPHRCQRCATRGKTWEGSDPICAFYKSGSFRTDNWNCATMNDLREVAEGYGYRSRINDISLVAVPDFNDGGHAVLSYYKDRGCVPIAYFLRDDEMEILNQTTAERILDIISKFPTPTAF